MLYETKAICVDFDGVIAEFADDIQDFGRLIPGAPEAISELKTLGYRIIIHTARPSHQDHKERLGAYLHTHGIPFDEINTNSHCAWESEKPVADLYIDDRALRFEGDWAHTLTAAKRHLGLTNGQLSYEQLLALITERRQEVEGFERFLREETSWLTSPASTRFHLAEEGGLVKHSLNVANTLLRLREALAPDIPVESCVIVALYHDAGKVGMPGQPFYVPNPSEWHVNNRGIQYAVNTDLVHLDVATRSLFLVARHIPLTDIEAQAIRYHDGQYIDENQSVAHRETPLTRLLQYADNWSGGVLESARERTAHVSA